MKMAPATTEKQSFIQSNQSSRPKSLRLEAPIEKDWLMKFIVLIMERSQLASLQEET